MSPQRAELIRRCALFTALRQDLLEHISSAAIERHMTPHRLLVSQGEPFHYLGIVLDGSVAAIASARGGKEQLLYEARAAETFAEIPLLDDGATLSRIAAGERGAVVLLVPKNTLDFACKADALMASRLARAAAARARILAQRLADLAFASTTSRVAGVILTFVRPAADGLAGAAWVEAPFELRRLSQTDVAGLAGTVRVVVARALQSLARGGGIVLERGRVVRINPAVLKGLV